MLKTKAAILTKGIGRYSKKFLGMNVLLSGKGEKKDYVTKRVKKV